MKYGFTSYKTEVEGHEFWVVESEDLKGCVAQGDTLAEALAQFEINEADWLDTATEVGIPIPKQSIRELSEYSGKLSLRIPKSLHKELAYVAKREEVSINQLLNTYIAKGIENSWHNKEFIKYVILEKERSAEPDFSIANSTWELSENFFTTGLDYRRRF